VAPPSTLKTYFNALQYVITTPRIRGFLYGKHQFGNHALGPRDGRGREVVSFLTTRTGMVLEMLVDSLDATAILKKK
jgi:hypothetical protein